MVLFSTDPKISIHAPREGGDFLAVSESDTVHTFQSTPPARGATVVGDLDGQSAGISIHAPHEGGRPGTEAALKKFQTISIHAPARGTTAKMHSFTCGPLTNK